MAFEQTQWVERNSKMETLILLSKKVAVLQKIHEIETSSKATELLKELIYHYKQEIAKADLDKTPEYGKK